MVVMTSNPTADLRPRHPVALRFGLLWVLATALGWTLAGSLASSVTWPNIVMGAFVRLALGGVLAGTLQWLVLRPQMDRSGLWALASLAAVALAGLAGLAAGVIAGTDTGWVFGAASLGTALGLLQWRVLRPHVRRSGWWVLASTVAWVVAGPLSGAADGILSWILFGIVIGTITAPVIVGLLRRRMTEAAHH